MDKITTEESAKIVEAQTSQMTEIEGGHRYLMATKAFHKMGELSRDKADLCIVGTETDEYVIGNWVTGFGFFNVCFPRDTTRELMEDEIEDYNKTYIQIASQPPYKLKVD